MNRFFIVIAGFILVIGVSATLGIILLRSPDTHSNLWNGVKPDYERTPIVVVGGEFNFELLGSETNYPHKTGRGVYLLAGCATCHGIDAYGGVVGASLAGSLPDFTTNVVRQGPYGMPSFPVESISDTELKILVAYLGGLPSNKTSAEERASLKSLTYDPFVALETLLNGKALMRRYCSACHQVPDRSLLLGGFEVGALLEEMVQDTTLSLEEAKMIADYIFAIRNNADPIQAP